MVTAAMKWTPARDTGPKFEELFSAEYRRVVAIARRVLESDAEAEDVAQEVFCAFYRAHPADAPFAQAWLYRAAAHTALNTIRGSKRRTRREALDAARHAPMQDSNDIHTDPEKAVIAAEQRREVQIALSRLPQKQAAVLALRYSGLSYAEVASALGVRIGQVGTLLRRAEEKLAKEMTRETH